MFVLWDCFSPDPLTRGIRRFLGLFVVTVVSAAVSGCESL